MAQRLFSLECGRTRRPGSIGLATGGLDYQSAHSVSVHRPGSPKKSSSLAAMGVAVVTLTGCLDRAPTYEERERIPPFVIVPSVKPDVDEVVRLATNKSLQIRVPFRSDDLGERLTAVFALDGSFQGSDDLGPSTFDDDTRAAEFT